MAHIHTKPGQHDHTASAFIVRTDFSEPKLMLHMHKKIHSYLQFGGHIELHETPWQAITHEIREESGYVIDKLKLLQPKRRLQSLTNVVLHPMPIYHNTHNFSETHFHTDVAYAFVADQKPSVKLDASESSEMLLVSRQELVDLSSDHIFESVREAGLFVFDHCLPHWEVVDQSNFA